MTLPSSNLSATAAVNVHAASAETMSQIPGRPRLSGTTTAIAISCRSGEPKVMWVEEGDPLGVALQGPEEIGVDPDAGRGTDGVERHRQGGGCAVACDLRAIAKT
jgi:hypothetical protein